jgi:hypothetical protein
MLRGVTSIAAFCLFFQFVAGATTPILADGKIEIKYVVTYLGVTIGSAKWRLALANDRYEINASARINGMASVLINGEGSGRARGSLSQGRAVASEFSADVVSTEENDTIRMALQAGVVRELVALPPFPLAPARVPVPANLLQSVIDPLSAVLIGADNGFGGSANDACKRRLPIFDGRRRYDVEVSFKGTEDISVPDGYRGSTIVCAVQLFPIAGQQVETTALRDLVESKDIEIWFAAIPQAHMLVPVRASVPTVIGRVHINPEQILIDISQPSQPPALANRKQ